VSTIDSEWGENSPLGRLWVTVTVSASERSRAPSVEFVCALAAERFGTTAFCLIVTGTTGIARLRAADSELGVRVCEIEATVGEGPIDDVLDLASPAAERPHRHHTGRHAPAQYLSAQPLPVR